MKICVVGVGYIGLPTATMFAKYNCEVVAVDVTLEVVEALNQGKIHIEEPGLQEVVKEVVSQGRLRASLVPEEADAFIIAVPTPNKKDMYLSCDLTYVLSAVESIRPYVRKGNVVIVESTIAPRTMDDFIIPIFEQSGFRIGDDLYLAHCPERVMPGQILYELEYNNRIVGGITRECARHAAEVYRLFVKGDILETEAKTAELSKCMENTYRDVNIALSNELAKICNQLEINCLDVIHMANKHPRVNLLQPGPGVGGHCLAIDPYFISATCPELAKIIRLARDTNCSMPIFVRERVEALLEGIEVPIIAVFGVTYKGNIDDIRESPALKIVHMLEEDGYQLRICDPHVPNPVYVSAQEAVKDANLILVLVDHDEFKVMDYGELSDTMKQPLVFDTRNIVSTQKWENVTVINYGNLYEYIRR